MGYHTFDADGADKLERPERRYRFLSTEELLWALALSSEDIVADLGSGTGFFTDDVAPHVSGVYAVDIQEAMHEYYEEKGVPENVELVTTGVEELPFEDGSLDAAFSTMTFHEFVSDDALAEIRRVFTPAGRLVIVDWTATGTGENGPPLDERYTADAAADALRDHGFSIEHQFSRPETFLLVATIE
ncbi:class I SAM-dependent methyltransferase [Halococcus qingdaonensis]|uniref:class I SAM-dependent methyltransferase n=1 Tax=Halococcus qingdaonensis TaxID=224402 RepID=UPI0021170AC8|nr:class I SAM-dependent methyltransferase [Halococcus qingdaonensis]